MEQNAKQQVVERLKGSTNVLVTVSKDPSVDRLAAAIALTLLINAMGKHATAVFSGKIPDTMQFLEPTKTLEDNVDSLRDFIIALDKNKADKLRYKVEDNVVKIFITPYRTRISDADLEFSQGDYNVDVVVALGVHKKDEIDNLLIEHGRILHDAAVISINTGVEEGEIGAINWSDSTASSLSEMLMSISEALQAGLVDEQIATALLTGIVSETDRFSNEKTSPKVMTMAAQLMAAGANQQLIANNLHPTIPAASVVNPEDVNAAKRSRNDGNEMTIEHEEGSESSEASAQKEKVVEIKDEAEQSKGNERPDDADTATDRPKAEDDADLPDMPPGPIASLIHDTKAFNQHDMIDKPLLGGTFNATATTAHEEEERGREKGINESILEHDDDEAPEDNGPKVDVSALDEPSDLPIPEPLDPNARGVPVPSTPPTQPADDFSQPLASLGGPPAGGLLPNTPLHRPMPSSDMSPAPASLSATPISGVAPSSEPQQPAMPPTAPAGEFNPAASAQQMDDKTLSSIDEQSRDKADEDIGSLDIESARQAVEQAMGAADFAPANNPASGVGAVGELDVQPPVFAPQSPDLADKDPFNPTAGTPMPTVDSSLPPVNATPPPATPPPFMAPPSSIPTLDPMLQPPVPQQPAADMPSLAPPPPQPPTAPPAQAPDDFTLPPIA